VDIEILDIWRSLHENEVRYLTIGGFAVNFYGFNRTTGDIDILIEDTTDNRKRLRKAFKAMGMGDIEQIESMQFIPGWTDFAFSPGIRLDVMTSIKGLDKKTFNELFNSSEITTIRSVPVRFIDYKNLILTKQATNRPKDQLDIEELEKIKKWSEGESK
jgi:hypothetical protein